MQLMRLLAAAAVAMLFSSLASAQVSIQGDDNRCNVSSAGSGNTINVTCAGISPAVVERLSGQLVTANLERQQLQESMDALAAKYLDLRSKLESAKSSDTSVLAAWKLLDEGNLGAAEAIIGTLGRIEVTLQNIDKNVLFDRDTKLIEQVASLADGSSRGQNEAMRRLIEAGNHYDGANLSGVNFSKGQLAGLRARGALLHAVDFSAADLSKADLSEVYLRFGDLSEARLADADLHGTGAAFLAARKADLSNANLRATTFIVSDFSNANFRNANLAGAVLAFSDLSGADFVGADLTGAYLTGSLLTGANFKGAKLDQLSVYGATSSGPVFDEEQSTYLCKHDIKLKEGNGLGIVVEISERWESNKYSTGYEYEDSTFLADRALLRQFGDHHQLALRECTTPSETPNRTFHAWWPGDMRYYAERRYFSKGNREAIFRQRSTNMVQKLEEAGRSGNAPWIR